MGLTKNEPSNYFTFVRWRVQYNRKQFCVIWVAYFGRSAASWYSMILIDSKWNSYPGNKTITTHRIDKVNQLILLKIHLCIQLCSIYICIKLKIVFRNIKKWYWFKTVSHKNAYITVFFEKIKSFNLSPRLDIFKVHSLYILFSIFYFFN